MAALSEKRAIVTGGASGIGRACTQWLAERGARVWVADFNPWEPTRSFSQQDNIVSCHCDVRFEENVCEIVEAAAAAGPIDILINCAGIECMGPITAVTEQEWDRCLDTNLKGAFLFCKHVIGKMCQHGGSIVNISSNAGVLPRTNDPVYCVSKAGLIMLTKVLALAHAPDRIRVNAVCPGPVIDTGMMDDNLAAAEDPLELQKTLLATAPLAAAHGRMTSPDEVAEAVGYLVSDAAEMVTGTLISIDGGKSLGVPPAANR